MDINNKNLKMRHKIYLNFSISDYYDITGEDISKILGMDPFLIFVKGQKRPGINMPEKPVARMNRWIMPSPLDEYALFEDQLNATLDIIEPKIHLFKPLCEKYRCEFACALYLYYNNEKSAPSIYLGERYNKLTKELKVAFDFDIYMRSDEEE